MQEDTGATITIEEADGVGKVQVSAPNKASIDAALGKIKAIVAVPEVGEVYEGTVRSIMPYGCFVEILPCCSNIRLEWRIVCPSALPCWCR